MKIALIGYGKMGHMIERMALSRGHEVVCRIDKGDEDGFASAAFCSADVAIEFTTPQTAESNIRKAWQAGVPVVCGTTGWTERLPLLRQELQHNGRALFWTSNFSVGVNVFFALNRFLGRLMQSFPQYGVAVEEIHHIHKLDAPSGTAVSLADDIVALSSEKQRWQLLSGTDVPAADAVPVRSVRTGEVPGTHIVTYDSAVDTITLRHEAKSREGFAAGAVLAAEFLKGKQGFFDMNDLLHLP